MPACLLPLIAGVSSIQYNDVSQQSAGILEAHSIPTAADEQHYLP